MKRLLSLLVFILFLSTLVSSQEGYRITVKAKGAANTTLKLAFHLGNQQYLKDSVMTDAKGQCLFSGEKELPAGVYMIVFPGKKYIEFLAEKDQVFTIACDTSDIASTLRFEGSDLNRNFASYQSSWKTLQEQAVSLQDKMKAAGKNTEEFAKLKDEYTSHETKMKDWLAGQEMLNRGTLLGAIVKSLIPVPVIPAPVPEGTKNQDSVRRLYSYIYYKDHFFDNIDLQNPGLIRSPILGTRLDQFFTQVVVQSPDSINKEADRLLKKCSVQGEVFQYVTSWIFNKYAASTYMGHDAIVVHLADSVYLAGKAPWASDEFIADLSKRVRRLKPNLIGSKAVNLVMDSFSGQYVSLDDVRAEYTILYFWEPDCGHCKEATPKLREFYNSNKDKLDLEVFAVCTKDNREKWEKYILDNNIPWINGWDPDRISHFDFYYNVESTPLIYILDRDKKIIAKKITVEDIGPFIESYKSYLRTLSGSSAR